MKQRFLIGAMLMVTKANDLQVKWTGGMAGSTLVNFSSGTGATLTYVSCTFKASDGMGTVPTAALTPLPTGTGTYSIAVQNTGSATAGGWSVYLSAAASGSDGQAKFQ